MTKRPDRLLILDIRNAAELISQFIATADKVSFADNAMMVSAVAYQLQIIGEASGQLTQSFKDKYPTVPWTDIRGMRNILVHVYHGMDIDVLWTTAVVAVPQFLGLIVGD